MFLNTTDFGLPQGLWTCCLFPWKIFHPHATWLVHLLILDSAKLGCAMGPDHPVLWSTHPSLKYTELLRMRYILIVVRDWLVLCLYVFI
jgi:hypothetical protein